MAEIPVNEALDMLKKGFKKEEIARTLEARGYTLQQISDAINQADIKQGVKGRMPGQEVQESIMDQELDIPLPDQAPAQQQQAPPAQQQYSSYQQYQMPQAQAAVNYDEIQALVEQIVEEKWKEMMRSVGDINVFKARVSDDMEAVKQELLRTQKRLEDLQVAVLGKVREYNDSVLGISNEMKALENVFSKIMEPLVTNVKELGKITEELKKK
jgi:SOS response regulatory protein OraA/RecX